MDSENGRLRTTMNYAALATLIRTVPLFQSMDSAEVRVREEMRG